MPHDFADLIADLEAAKAGLARSVKRTRNLVGEHRSSPTADEEQEPKSSEPDRGVFNWVDRQDQ